MGATWRSCQGGRHFAVIPDEPAVKVCKAQEALQLLLQDWDRPVHHHLHLGQILGELPLPHHKTQERQESNVELSLLCLYEQTVLQRVPQNHADVLHEVLLCH